ncbi:MAG: D-glycerate dehydrogenase, partial [Paracoccaceae bacterium]|nr:D-glycerate dehydrogenase [Paracoccaceae bacterium]
MAKSKLNVVLTRKLPDIVETRMSELFNVKVRDDDHPMTRNELAAAMAWCDVLVP